MDMDFVTLLKDFGVPMAMVIFLVWKILDILKAQLARVQEVETSVRSMLVGIINDATTATQKNSDATNRLCEILQDRPCLLNHIHDDDKPKPLNL
jgi:hypothetical protein